MNIITFNYSTSKEQAFPRFLKNFDEMQDVIKIDCLKDAIYYLEKEIDKIMEKTRGEK
jgi:hypothetical protein|tara:strand:+ start:922 stop:1095 length:174 start_codon:yes stop_codon:yes gene_type:complete